MWHQISATLPPASGGTLFSDVGVVMTLRHDPIFFVWKKLTQIVKYCIEALRLSFDEHGPRTVSHRPGQR
ncbi:hypothetical protein GCM10009802_06130 [Streptomyces synnematoformans]|uniref:Uncharacterized protein n=1 Tax=Streptomyces synnematoformans TaxID=415721 RepID=A0ABN2XCG8_9ACTN